MTMKTIKRMLSILMVSILLLAGSATSPVIAASNPAFSITQAQGKQGDEISVAINISNNPGIIALRLSIQYDASALELTRATPKDYTSTTFGPLENNPFILSWEDAIHDNTTTNGTIAQLTFVIREDATVGNTSILITYDPEDVFDQDWENVHFETVAGTVAVSCAEHQYGNLIPEVPAKCGVEGQKAYYACSVCHKLFDVDKNEITEQDLVIPALNHVAETGWRSDPDNHWHTCGACGTVFDKAPHSGGEATCTAQAICFVCGAEYGELNPDNHVNTEIRDAVAATEESEGYTGDIWCKDCGEKITEGAVIPKLDHTHNMVETQAKAATHEEDGNIAYYTCTKCGKLYRDAAGTQQITLADTVVPATGHTYSAEYQFDANGHWRACSCGERTDAGVHTYGGWTVTKAPTSTADGTRERACTLCGYTQTEVVPATGSDEKPDITEPAVKYGDVNNDGKYTATDAMYIRLIVAQLDGPSHKMNYEAADVTGDGKYTAADTMYIRRLVAELITEEELPVVVNQ